MDSNMLEAYPWRLVMWAPVLFLWVVSTAGYLWWDPIVGFYALIGGPLMLALALWPAWLETLWATFGVGTPPLPRRMRVVPRSVALTLAWFWAVGWTFAMPNPIILSARELIPAIGDAPGTSLLLEFTRWVMNHPRYALPLFFLTGWCVAALWSLREQGPRDGAILWDQPGDAHA